jgi:hypothetical protein
MPERSSLNQVVQIGVETTSGTAVAASKRLTALSIEPSVNADIDTFRPAGQKYASLTSLGREWIEADLSGRATYTEIIYPLSSVVDTATITTPGGGTTSRQWVFESDSTADDVPKTFTVEHGSGVRSARFAYGQVTELGLAFSRDAIEVSGSMMGKALEDPFTLTGAATALALIPVQPTEVTVYMDTTSAGLGTTKLTRVLSADWSLGSRFGPVYVLDAANTGFVAMVETEPDLTLDLVMEADANGMAQLARLRDGATRFIRIEALGATIETTIKYTLRIDMAVKVSDTGGFSDEDGVYAIEWNFTGVHDATWGKSFSITVINTLTAL